MSNTEVDILVIGAGVAGLSATEVLVEKGYSVCLMYVRMCCIVCLSNFEKILFMLRTIPITHIDDSALIPQ